MVCHTIYDPSTKTWSGLPLKPIYNPDLSIATAVFDELLRNAQSIGQVNDNNGVQFTNMQIRMHSIRLAMNLQRDPLGVRKDDVIGLVTRNHEMVSAVVFAAFALAAPVNALDPNFKVGRWSSSRHMVEFSFFVFGLFFFSLNQLLYIFQRKLLKCSD